MYTSIQVPELNSTRRIWVYLPDDYPISEKRYPVLYMQDGQNLFDAQASFSGEWEIDEYLDSVNASLIVAGIDNGGERRINEYNPNDTEAHGQGLGKEYLARIAGDLKPYMDSHFRTLPDAAHTAIAGSSMGGLISFYAGLYHPDVFGKVGVFSPSFWLVPNLTGQVTAAISPKHKAQHYYFFGGGRESDDMVEQLSEIAQTVKQKAKASVVLHIEPMANHSEASWKKMFPDFFKWLTAP